MVDGVEVEFADDQGDDGLDGGQARETASAALGGLEQAVDGLQESVGLTGLRPSHDALQVAAHEGGDLLHRLDLGAHDADAPMGEHGAHHVDLLALQDLAQLLLVEPRSSRAHGGHSGDQGVEVSCGCGLQARAVREQRPAHAAEGLPPRLLAQVPLTLRRSSINSLCQDLREEKP